MLLISVVKCFNGPLQSYRENISRKRLIKHKVWKWSKSRLYAISNAEFIKESQQLQKVLNQNMHVTCASTLDTFVEIQPVVTED